jgi:hypothetical protein
MHPIANPSPKSAISIFHLSLPSGFMADLSDSTLLDISEIAIQVETPIAKMEYTKA